uniref:Uncharacterized protein n=1 Tax=viral metagenome TaxID=1070528 RepID=A0A6C0K146_9ZZZZ
MKIKPYIIKAVVNGLIASSVIWAFWVPLLITVVGPFINANIKEYVCKNAYIPKWWDRDTRVPQKIIGQDKLQFQKENLIIFMFLAFTGFMYISISLYVAYRLILAYNLNIRNIAMFNALMAVIIVVIEVIFFATVTTVYIPFSSKDLLEAIRNKFNAEVSVLY